MSAAAFSEVRSTADLPMTSADPAKWSVRAMSRPATEFTGDFYFAAEIDDAFWFAVGDFAGHGLEAAIFMVMIQEEIERVVHTCHCADPAEVVVMLDSMLRDEIPLNRFATLVVGKARDDGSVQLVNAGHCFPILARADQALEIFGSNGPIVGIHPSARWKEVTLQLETGDRLIVHTDGFSEAQDPMGNEFGVAGVRDLVRRTSSEEPLETFFDTIDRFTGGEQVDDMTIFALSRS